MKENIRITAKKYINSTCKNYEKIFCYKDINKIMSYAIKILEKKFLKINRFCYYVDYGLKHRAYNFNLYINLSKENRRKLDFYQISFIKIKMHIYCIFREIEKINNVTK